MLSNYSTRDMQANRPADLARLREIQKPVTADKKEAK